MYRPASNLAPSNALGPTAYDDVIKLAARQLRRDRARRSISTTDLAHEALERYLRSNAGKIPRSQLLGHISVIVRQVLVDRARKRQRIKRGEGREPVQLAVDQEAAAGLGVLDVLAVHEELERLAAIEERQAKVVEMKFFAGFGEDDIADALGCSARTVRNEWRKARAWLEVRLEDAHDE